MGLLLLKLLKGGGTVISNSTITNNYVRVKSLKTVSNNCIQPQCMSNNNIMHKLSTCPRIHMFTSKPLNIVYQLLYLFMRAIIIIPYLAAPQWRRSCATWPQLIYAILDWIGAGG